MNEYSSRISNYLVAFLLFPPLTVLLACLASTYCFLTELFLCMPLNLLLRFGDLKKPPILGFA